MFLCELFDSGNDMEERLRQSALEVITPYLAQGLPFVTMQQVIDAMRRNRSGMDITRGLLMKILDPNKVKAVDKIEGDHIVLAKPDEGDENKDDAQAEAEQQQQSKDHVDDMAQNVAKDAMSA